MINNIYNILKNTGLPLAHNVRPDISKDNNIVVSYHLFNEKGYQFGEGKINTFGGSVQVDLFAKHKVDYMVAKNQIMSLLTSHGFKLANINTSTEVVDSVGFIDHTIFIFNYIEIQEVRHG